MILKTLDVLGLLHGYGIARRIEQISRNLLAVNQGTLYPVLLNRLTREGRKQLEAETKDWEQTQAIIGRFFEVQAEDVS